MTLSKNLVSFYTIPYNKDCNILTQNFSICYANKEKQKQKKKNVIKIRQMLSKYSIQITTIDISELFSSLCTIVSYSLYVAILRGVVSGAAAAHVGLRAGPRAVPRGRRAAVPLQPRAHAARPPHPRVPGQRPLERQASHLLVTYFSFSF